VEIASHDSVLLSRGWLITIEAPGHPRYPPSTQLDAIVNSNSQELRVGCFDFVSYLIC